MRSSPRVWLTPLACFVVSLVVGAFADAPAQVAQVNGKVTLKQADGTTPPVAAGQRIISGETIMTAQNSSAVVSLGKLGRVEVLPETTLKLTYDDAGYTAAMLSPGRVRVSSSAGVNATTSTDDGSIVSNNRKKAEFLVDTTCGNTFVAVKKGTVELRAGNTVKQIAAGGQDTAGQARPGCTPGAK